MSPSQNGKSTTTIVRISIVGEGCGSLIDPYDEGKFGTPYTVDTNEIDKRQNYPSMSSWLHGTETGTGIR